MLTYRMFASSHVNSSKSLEFYLNHTTDTHAKHIAGDGSGVDQFHQTSPKSQTPLSGNTNFLTNFVCHFNCILSRFIPTLMTTLRCLKVSKIPYFSKSLESV